MANHAGPGVGLRKEGLRRAGSVGCCRPLSCPARAPRALLATAGRYGVTGVTVHNSDLSETGARLKLHNHHRPCCQRDDGAAWNPRDAPMYRTKGAFCYTTAGAAGRLVVTPRAWPGG